MITQYEVSPLIRKELPELYNHEVCVQTSLEVYILMNHFADFTGAVVRNHRYKLARKCFVLAEILFRHGDAQVRRLVENIFIYSFSSFMPSETEERRQVRSLIPVDLYSAYLKQISMPGC